MNHDDDDDDSLFNSPRVEVKLAGRVAESEIVRLLLWLLLFLSLLLLLAGRCRGERSTISGAFVGELRLLDTEGGEGVLLTGWLFGAESVHGRCSQRIGMMGESVMLGWLPLLAWMVYVSW